ncbi:AMP nucleosidase [Candidatus Cytomitobacter indipagum]|uniref:AMP nucleosidase n=1 Tax=Candidatus Cytomitobacter indipagum TaxID=2601575 RepID=A0A5C0UD52_9PROT|nr:AMP nucleosidase [Candidatus Cytomitobacter indipagum]QEK37955.1 AMP nucleosidase [Candidatus Cytomitobacter indipagum]
MSTVFDQVIKNIKKFTNITDAFSYCIELYEEKTKLLTESADCENRTVNYPYIGIISKNDQKSCYYGNTITHPVMLKRYYTDQINKIIKNGEFEFLVGESYYPMSLAFVCEDLFNIVNKEKSIIMPCITRIRKGMQEIEYGKNIKRIGFFHAEHIDYCLNRLHHYCGSHSKHFQNNIIFANYKMYVDFFVEDGKKWVNEGIYECLLGPDIEYYGENHENNSDMYSKSKKHSSLPQMPAYHLKKANGDGITIVNVGVGPSNSKSITDHLAVLAPKSWLMLGHCAGLHNAMKLGDYVIAQNYIRYDYVLDKHVPNKIPIPSCGKIVKKLEDHIEECKINGEKLYKGSLITTADRNWELDCEMVHDFIESKAIAIDMESATIATNAFRFSIPCATFLCISDMPLHGKIKLRGMAKNFYQTKVRHHFNIGMFSIQDLYKEKREKANKCTKIK